MRPKAHQLRLFEGENQQHARAKADRTKAKDHDRLVSLRLEQIQHRSCTTLQSATEGRKEREICGGGDFDDGGFDGEAVRGEGRLAEEGAYDVKQISFIWTKMKLRQR